VDTGLNLADVTEVANGHIAAMERAVPGQRYILGGQDLTLKQILDKLAAMTGLPSPTMKVPHAVALGFASSTRYSLDAFAGKNRGQPSTLCAWDVRRCLPHPQKQNANWDTK